MSNFLPFVFSRFARVQGHNTMRKSIIHIYISRQKVVAAALRFFEGLVNPMHCGDTVRGSSVLHVLRFARSCTTLARNLFFEEYIIQYPVTIELS